MNNFFVWYFQLDEREMQIFILPFHNSLLCNNFHGFFLGPYFQSLENVISVCGR